MVGVSEVKGGHSVFVSYQDMPARRGGLPSDAPLHFERLEDARQAMDSIKARMISAGGIWHQSRETQLLPGTHARAECIFNDLPRPCGKSLLSRMKTALVSVCETIQNWFARLLGKAAPVPTTPTAVWYDTPNKALPAIEAVSQGQAGEPVRRVRDEVCGVARQASIDSLSGQWPHDHERMDSEDGLWWDSGYDPLALEHDGEANFNKWVHGPDGLEAVCRIALDAKHLESIDRPLFSGRRGSV